MLALRRHTLVAAYVLALAPAVLMAFAQPVWSRVDEAHHADFVIQLSHGVYPVANRTLIDPVTLSLMESTGVYRAFYPAGSYPTPDLSDVGPPPAGMSDAADATWMSRHLWQLSQESIQPPLYYAAMVPVWMVADGLGGPLAGVYALRLVNALILATLAPIAFAVARRLVPSQPGVAVVAALMAAFVPGSALNGTRISNDTLAVAIGGVLLLLAVRWAREGWTWRRALIAGLVLGAGLLTKVTLAGLIPAVLISSTWPQQGGGAWRAGLARSAVSGALGVAFLIPWFALNERFYGAIMPNASLRLSDSLPTSFTPSLAILNVSVFDLTFWTGEPWGALPLAAPFAVFASLIGLMAIVAVIRGARSSGEGLERGALAVAATATAGMVVLSLALPALAAFEFVAPGRYAYPALPAVAALGAAGLWIVLANHAARQAATALYAAFAALILVVGAAAPTIATSDPGGGTGAPPAAARAVDVSASQSLAGLTVTVDRVAFDPDAGATWLHVTASNSGAQEVEWPASPVVYAGDTKAIGDYSKSTHLAGDLDPGQTVSGWMYVPLQPASLHAGDSLRAVFADVTPIDYQSIGDIELTIAVTS